MERMNTTASLAAFLLGSSLGTGQGAFAKAAKEATESLAIMTLPAQEVCAGTAYINGQGEKVVGTKDCQAKACTKAGQSGCLTTARFPAIDAGAIAPEQLVKGYSLGGVTGSFDPHGPKPKPCTVHGDSYCIATAAFPAVERALLTAGNIVKGVTFPNMATGAYPSAKYPLAGYDPKLKVLTAKGLSRILTAKGSLQFWTIRGERQVVAIDVGLAPANIPTGKAIHGIKGTMTRDSLPDCRRDGQFNCLVKSGFVAVKATELLPENFRRGVKVSDSITGTYPSPRTPLASGSEQVVDLSAATFSQRLASDASFEFFDRFGRRYSARGDSDLHQGHIKAGVSLWGTTGSFKGLASDESFDAFDVLKGQRVGTIQGQLDPFCASHGTCRADYWQDRSVDDNGDRATCGSGNANTCVFVHKLTKRTWLLPKVSSTLNWTAATALCQGERFDGHSDWRLPSQKEALQAMAQGMKALPFHGRYSTQFEGSERFWTSTAGGKGRLYFAPRTLAAADHLPHNAGAAYPICIR